MIKLNLPNKEEKDKIAFIIENVFSIEECNELIQRTEKQGYIQAQVNVGNGKEVTMTDYRNSLRCIIDDELLASVIFNRIEQYLPKFIRNKPVVCMNERLRFLKYLPGHFFKPHYDGNYIRDDKSEVSYLTIQLYLNEGSIGGATRFYDRYDMDNYIDVIPKTGLILVFQHDIYHEGTAVNEGVKYVMRSDIMYNNK
uniref:Prolyl 4-hydroxylase alpha subunit domain-containing protein n=1 Tax=Chromulina nebulosa TaxID=96789 RepID=A0A7S0XDJ2_9STRA|mmetsp:Transcript_328/g.287  ORF Transcript_328/g.287 Transcript_328/m.287 type:complete len:197 (+) Transcript_328:16-606(+)